MLHIYNTLTGKNEPFPKTRKRINMFVCGPTVYDLPHIGHARTYLAFDIIVRWLRRSGYKIFYLQNITDIDDKIIERARTAQKDPLALAKGFEREHLAAMETLGITTVDAYARATDHIADIVKQVQRLITKGHAYLIPGDGYYFDLSTFPDYGKLSRRTASQAEDAISRIDDSVRKRNRGDFCLWKFPAGVKNPDTREPGDRKTVRIFDGEPAWWTPLGWGRPGWHIEDTAITEHEFGPQYDIHGGGIDLKFPHHEAEIAQQEAASGKKPFVKAWMHAGHLLVRGEKMSKSLGNFITIRDFLSVYDPRVLRYLVAGTHYRSPIDYTEEKAEGAVSALAGIFAFLARLPAQAGLAASGKISTVPAHIIQDSAVAFEAAMNDDINTSSALAALHELISRTEKNIASLTAKNAKNIYSVITDQLAVLGITAPLIRIPKKLTALAAKRERLRAEKRWQDADALREEASRAGYTLEDTPRGPLILPLFSKILKHSK